jgi:hypothetical protein
MKTAAKKENRQPLTRFIPFVLLLAVMLITAGMASPAAASLSQNRIRGYHKIFAGCDGSEPDLKPELNRAYGNFYDDFASGSLDVPKRLTGQEHHGISKKIHKALEQHPKLKGQYQARDPRLVTQAKDIPSHKGYQKWHRDLDAEVAEWVETHPKATTQDFENFLRQRYSQPDLIDRFPEVL